MLPMDYHGTTLHACDVALIDAPSWLNDNVIGFVYEWYAHEKYAKERDLEFVNPAVVFIIMHEDDDECLAPLIESVDLARRSLVFMPINNNVNVTAAGGGSHWSLLVLDRIAQQYVHFDSMRGSNMQYARQVAKQIGKCSPELASWTMSVGDCPQQDNANDCGVFVLEMTQQASDWFKDHRSLNGFKAAVKPGMIGARRRAVKELVREIERRSSG